MFWLTVLCVFGLSNNLILSSVINSSTSKKSAECNVPQTLKNEISHYQSFVDNVITNAVQGRYSKKYFQDLTGFIDKFGNRISGSKNLERSIKYLKEKLTADGVKVQLEPVSVPYWIRGNESAYLLAPRFKELKILGLGFSPGTNTTGLTGDVVVVSDFDDLNSKAKEVKGKIVLFNKVFTDYYTTVQYRSKGPVKAAKLGAIAALVRSVTPFSLYSPHTGTTDFGPSDPQIPAAAVTLEDADMMARFYARGIHVTVNIKMEGRTEPNHTSNNMIVDVEGFHEPNHFSVVSGHIDSWDVGDGALDDGAGAFLALHSLLLIKFMGVPQPRRTLRAILWTGEEQGLIGAKSYLQNHKDEIRNWTIAMESDNGVYKPLGLSFFGESDDAYCIMQEILCLFKSLNATETEKNEWVGSDISVFKQHGVPLGEPLVGANNYMWYHHTQADSLRALNSKDMDENLAVFSAVAYILANLSIPLPRKGESIWDLTHQHKHFE